VGSAPEIVRHGRTGFLGKTSDLAGFVPAAGALDRAACRRDVEERFSAARMVADHLQLYADLLETRPAGGVPEAVRVHQNR
jgi:hypothetical protein